MSLAGELCSRTLMRVLERFPLQEHTGAGGGPYLPLPGPMPGAGGECRVWSGGSVERVVYVGLAFPPAELDSHMVFAFGPTGSAVPHFTLDSVSAGGGYAFHLDLIQRVDLGANLAYLDAVYGELTESFEQASAIEGLTRAHLSPRQLALMSPWMLAHRADAAAFGVIEPHVQAYVDHWAKLVVNGIPVDADPGLDATALADRDRRNRAALFNADVDPVWDQIAPIIGADNSERIQQLLRGEEL
jgi:hypothetical protein